MQAQDFAQPVAEDEGERGKKKLLQSGGESAVGVFIDQPQAVEDGEAAERGLEKILGARGQRLARREPIKCADQNAERVEKCTDHAVIVARRRRKGNEEKFSLGAAGVLDFSCIEAGSD